MDRQVKVFIFNDHQLITEAMAALLESRQETKVVGWSGTLKYSRVKSNLLLADIVLLNATLETSVAIQLLANIKDEFPQIKVIVIGIDPVVESVLEFIEAGASGYVFKDSSFDQLLNIILDVQDGKFSCSPRIAARVFARVAELSRESNSYEAGHDIALSLREKDILRLIASGLGNKEIAQNLSISISTVKNHIHNLFNKLRVSDRKDVIKRALQRGMQDELSRIDLRAELPASRKGLNRRVGVSAFLLMSQLNFIMEILL